MWSSSQVSMLALYSIDLSSNPAEVYSFNYVKFFEKNDYN